MVQKLFPSACASHNLCSLYDYNCFVSLQIYVPTNPPGAETLPPGIIVPQTDLYLRRLWGVPSEV
jgi:hypothetical protein